MAARPLSSSPAASEKPTSTANWCHHDIGRCRFSTNCSRSGIILSGGPEQRLRARRSWPSQLGSRKRLARPRHLLRNAADCPRKGRQSRTLRLSGSMDRPGLRPSTSHPLFRGIAGRARRLDESRRSGSRSCPRASASAGDSARTHRAQRWACESIIGVQFHPEVVHTPMGRQMLRNFLFDICGCERQLDTRTRSSTLRSRRSVIGSAKTGFSWRYQGGVDSSVVAALHPSGDRRPTDTSLCQQRPAARGRGGDGARGLRPPPSK